MAYKRSANRPHRQRENELKAPEFSGDFDQTTPKFCLHHIAGSFGVSDLPERQQAKFALSLEERSSMTWQQIKLAYRHGYGSDLLPKRKIKPSIPTHFAESEKFMVLRYDGNLPMVGIRVRDVFHVIWIEANYGDVYDHK